MTAPDAIAEAKAAGYTDAERWNLDAMRVAWAGRYYEQGHAWSFTADYNGWPCIVLSENGAVSVWRLHGPTLQLPDPNLPRA